MMLSDEVKSLIHLSIIPGVGNQTIRCLLAAFGSAQRALTATSEELAQIDGLTRNARQRLVNGRSRVSLNRELELIQSHQCHIVTFEDETYPPLLKQIDDPPLLLYIKRQLPSQDTLSIAIVGSRSPTLYGRTTCHQLSQLLAARGVTIVSGFARGIDTSAHRGALEAGGRTIAVMGNGLSHIYPEENRDLADEILESGGALISEFPMTVPPMGTNFPLRNRVISGLTYGTLVVEASERSGSLITARLAAEQGREVFAVPGQIFSKLSQGTHRLINEGATLIHSVDDLFDGLPQNYVELAASIPPSSQSRDQEPPPLSTISHPRQLTLENLSQSEDVLDAPPAPSVQLTPDEGVVLSAIDSPTSHIDQIVRASQLPINRVSSILLTLELKGVVEQLPGKQFAIK
jgi:DNA processing protein